MDITAVKLRRIFAAILIIVGLSACSPGQAEQTELPEPGQLFERIRQTVRLPEMVDVAADMLEANTGISAGEYVGAAYYIPMDSVVPEELILIRAVDEAAALDIQEKLESYLDYRVESARVYLTEYMPVLQAGVVRRDGLTVSLIVSEQVSEIVAVYENW